MSLAYHKQKKNARELAAELASEYRIIANAVKGNTPEQIFEQLYSDWSVEDARIVSRREREQYKYKEASLTYGEIQFDAFRRMFSLLYEFGLPATGGVFLDIGCGSGRPV